MNSPRIVYNVRALLSEFLSWTASDNPNMMNQQQQYPNLYEFCKQRQVLKPSSVATELIPLHTKGFK